jgi:ribosomal protein S18 acetylase RimI-like enzyme
MIIYKPIDFFEPGLIQKLLKKSYQDLFQYFPNEKQRLYKQWEHEDKEVFNYPDTIGRHVLFTCINDNPIGYFSWDDRKFPQGIIGQNCVLPDHQKQGFGRKQVDTMIKIFEDTKFEEISVVTGNHKFFEPAQKIYINCGFKEKRRFNGDLFERIEFSKLL